MLSRSRRGSQAGSRAGSKAGSRAGSLSCSFSRSQAGSDCSDIEDRIKEIHTIDDNHLSVHKKSGFRKSLPSPKILVTTPKTQASSGKKPFDDDAAVVSRTLKDPSKFFIGSTSPAENVAHRRSRADRL